MNQEIIDVKLVEIDKNDVLSFNFDDDNIIDVNLNSVNGQQDFKAVFSELLKRIYEKDVQLKLIISDGYKKGLYKEVCQEYIDDLNKELREAREEIFRL